VLFCLIDDAYAALNPHGARRYESIKRLSDSEVIALALFQQLRGVESERSFLRDAQRFFSHLFGSFGRLGCRLRDVRGHCYWGLGSFVGGILGDRWGRTRTTAAMMVVSGSCAVLIGLLFGSPTWLVLLVSLVWGFAIVADSAQFSTMVTELSDQAYVGTALTLQLAGGFALTVPTIWLIPLFEDALGWRWAFAFLALGPALGVVAMLRLKSLPEAAHIAGGRG
jgi:Major Facilitator Superfamily